MDIAPFALSRERITNSSKVTRLATVARGWWTHGVGARRGKRASIGTSFYRGIDLDLNGKNEENGGPTFSAITARSYHPGGVNSLLGDGSVRFVKSTVDGMVWR